MTKITKEDVDELMRALQAGDPKDKGSVIFVGEEWSLPGLQFMRQWIGKIRRLIKSIYQSKPHPSRRGDCVRCGACCHLGFRCPLYKNNKCTIYNHKSRVCNLFPMDKRDLKDRDRQSPHTKCGYWFKEDE